MPVSSFECQIARGQIGRYVEGGSLSAQAMTSLEEHLAECADCKALVAERRAALLGTLSTPAKAVVEMPVENPLIAALRSKQEAAPEKPKVEAPKTKAAPRYAKAKEAKEPTVSSKKPLGKPLALAALLAVVLLGMSRVSSFVGSPTAKASASFAAESMPKAETPAVETPKLVETTPASTSPTSVDTKPVAEAPKTATAPATETLKIDAPKLDTAKPTDTQTVTPKAEVTKPAEPVVKPVAQKPVIVAKPNVTVKPVVKPVVKKPITKKSAAKAPAKRVVRRAVKRKPVARLHRKAAKRIVKKSHSSVRVYGLDGHPLN